MHIAINWKGGTGRVRRVEFESVDLQPCGGAHVKSRVEIGAVRVRKIEKKREAQSARQYCV